MNRHANDLWYIDNTRMEIWQLPNDLRRECIDLINCKNVEYSSTLQISVPTRNVSTKWIYCFVTLDRLKVLTTLGQTIVAKAHFNPILVGGWKLINDVYG